MRKLLILITLCLPVVVWAQDTRKITGRVLEAASGEPLPGATVFIDPDAPEAKEYNPAGTVTDVSGKFELTCFDSLCGGEFYRIRGFKSGYIGKDRIYFPPEGRSESVG